MSEERPKGNRALLAVFTPSASDPNFLKSFTVGRDHEFATLTRALAEAATTPARPHVLLVGSRGSGKSHLMTLAADHARTTDLGGPVNLAWLAEDIYSITSYRDLLAELVVQVTGDLVPGAATIEELERTLVEIAETGVVVALVENLNRIMALIGREGQHALRAFLHNEHAVLILASSPSLFDGVTSHAEPFYGAFRVVQLGELSVGDGRELLLRLARHDGDERLGQFLMGPTGLARLEAVAHLAGGLPRLWLLLAGCLTVELLDELVPLFVKLLDELTPYYKARMDDLSPTKAKIVSVLCFARGGGALNVREICEHIGSTHQTTSKVLNELERERFVVGRKVAGTDQRTTYYELREPLLRHCLDLKNTKGSPLAVIVEVLRGWFDAQALREVLASAEPGSVGEEYSRAALMVDARPEPTDRAYSGGQPADLLSEIRLGRYASAPASTTVAIEAIVVLATDGKDDAERLMDARTKAFSELDLRRAKAIFERASQEIGAETGIDRVGPGLRSAVEADPTDDLLALIAGGWLLGTDDANGALAVLQPAHDRAHENGIESPLALAIAAELAFALWETGDQDQGRAIGEHTLERRRALLGDDHPDTLTSRGNLAHWISETSDPATARDLFADLAADRAKVLGPDHPDTLSTRHSHAHWVGQAGDAAAATELLATLVAERSRVLGADHVLTLSSRHSQAYWVGREGDAAASRDLFAALASDRERVLGPDHPDTLAARNEHGFITAQAGDLAAACDLLSRVIADRTRVLGPHHPDTLVTRRNHAYLVSQTRELQTARDLYTEMIADHIEALGPDHPSTLAVRTNQARLIGETGDPATARDLLATVVTDRTRILGPDHPDTHTSRHNHAYWTNSAGDPATARDLFGALLPDRISLLGPDHPDTLATRENHAYATARAGDDAAARDLYGELIADRARIDGAGDRAALAARYTHARLTGETGDPATARDLLTALVADRTRLLGADHPDTHTTRHNVAYWASVAGDTVEARDGFAALIPDRTRVLGADHPDTLTSRHNHAQLVGLAGDPATARDLLSAIVADRTRILGADHPDTLTSRHSHARWVSEAGDSTTGRDMFTALAHDRERLVGPDDPETLAARYEAARSTGAAGDPGAAQELLGTLVADHVRILGADHPNTLTTRSSHAYWTGRAGDPAQARDLMSAIAEDTARALGEEDPMTTQRREDALLWRGLAGEPAEALLSALRAAQRSEVTHVVVGRLMLQLADLLGPPLLGGRWDEVTSILEPLHTQPANQAIALLTASIRQGELDAPAFVHALSLLGLAGNVTGAIEVIPTLASDPPAALRALLGALPSSGSPEDFGGRILPAAVAYLDGDGGALAALPIEERVLAAQLAGIDQDTAPGGVPT